MATNPVSDIDLNEMQNRVLRMEKMMDKLDVDLQETRMELEQEKKQKRAMQEQLDLAKSEIDSLMTPDFRYQQLGGDEYYYMDLDQYLRVMRKQCGEDQRKLEELADWEERARQLGTKRVMLSAVKAAETGAVIGLVVVAASHCCADSTLVTGAFTCTVKAAAMALGIKVVVAFAFSGLVIYGIRYGGVKMYRWYKAKNKVEEILGGPVNEDLPDVQNGNHVNNLHQLVDEGDKTQPIISVNLHVGAGKYLVSA